MDLLPEEMSQLTTQFGTILQLATRQKQKTTLTVPKAWHQRCDSRNEAIKAWDSINARRSVHTERCEILETLIPGKKFDIKI